MSEAHDQRIDHGLPVQHGNGRLANRPGLNTRLDGTEYGGKGRGRPPRCGQWAYPLHLPDSRGEEGGAGSGSCEAWHRELLVRLPREAVSLVSPSVQGYPAGLGAVKKNGLQARGHSQVGWPPPLPLGAAAAPPGRRLRRWLAPLPADLPLL